MKVVLASASPRRQQLLRLLVKQYEVRPAFMKEEGIEGEGEEIAEELSYLKARRIAEKVDEEVPTVVIGADTLIEKEGQILGKPTNRREAEEMIDFLSGARHKVITGVTVINVWGEVARTESEVSWVEFNEVSEMQKKKYLESDIWRDKAGAYAIQKDPVGLVKGFEGSLSNIIGLPLGLTKSLLEEVGLVVGDEGVDKLEERVWEMMGRM